MRKITFLIFTIIISIHTWGQTVDIDYLNPTSVSSDYKFLRFGNITEYYAGFMYNIQHAAYGDGNDFTLFTYDNRDLVLRSGTGNIVMHPDNKGNVGIGTTSPDYPLSIGYNNGGGQLGFERLDGADAATMYLDNTNALNILIGSGSGDFKIQQNVAGAGLVSTLFMEGLTGNIGIGTTSPDHNLTVYDESSAIIQVKNANRSSTLQQNTSGGALNLYTNAGLSNVLIRSYGDTYFNGGNVGIGTTSPYTKLQVGQNNSSKTSGELMRLSLDVNETGVKTALHIDANPSSSSWDRGVAIELGLKSTTYNEYTSRIVHYGYSASTRASKLQLQTHSVTDGVWNTGILIDDVGNVGIGTTDPTYLLSVKGTIGCGEVIVENVTGWADFVFEDDYNLMPLQELDNYIQENKHLPEIPTTEEVQENGISVGEMNAKLLQKIEELTLYVIELKKENEEQLQMNKQLINRIEKLENLSAARQDK